MCARTPVWLVSPVSWVSVSWRMKAPICWAQPRGRGHHLHFTAPRHPHTQRYHMLQGDMHLTPPLLTLSLSLCICLTLPLLCCLGFPFMCVVFFIWGFLPCHLCWQYRTGCCFHCVFAASHRKGCCLCLSTCHMMPRTKCLASQVIWLHNQSQILPFPVQFHKMCHKVTI